MMIRKDKKCLICGVDMINVPAHQKFCKDCALNKKQIQKKESARRKYKNDKEEVETKEIVQVSTTLPDFIEFFNFDENPKKDKENARPYKHGTHHLDTTCKELSEKKMSYADYQKQKTFEMIKERMNEQSL